MSTFTATIVRAHNGFVVWTGSVSATGERQAQEAALDQYEREGGDVMNGPPVRVRVSQQ